LSDRVQGGMAGHQGLQSCCIGPRRCGTDLQPEAAQNTADAHLYVMKLSLQEFARRQDRAHFLSRQGLAMHRPEPA